MTHTVSPKPQYHPVLTTRAISTIGKSADTNENVGTAPTITLWNMRRRASADKISNFTFYADNTNTT